MKKIIFVVLLSFLLTGCTVVRIDTKNIDNTINVILSKDNQLFNHVGHGYKYYIPRGVSYIDTTSYNEKLYTNGIYLYLYIDVISYFYGKNATYEVNKDAYYSSAIQLNNKKGYLEINQNGDLYLVEFMYNYAKIEALVEKDRINDVILNASYILSTIKFNNNVIQLMLDNNYFIDKEEQYDIFTSQKTTNKFLEFREEN